MSNRPCSDARGFTLVETLVVIGIIALLIGLVVAITGALQRSARITATQQQINTIAAAIDAYHTDHRAYPGPLPDDATYSPTSSFRPANTGAGGRVTMAENLVLGLIGGLRPQGNAFDGDRLFKGAATAVSSSPPKVYLERITAEPWLSDPGRAFTDRDGRTAGDSLIPEFLDQSIRPLPILYLRAKPAAAGIMSDGSQLRIYQYDLRQITAYTDVPLNLKSGQSHGLRQLGNESVIGPIEQATSPYQALPYFRQPETLTTNATGTPRQKDRYILIAAGRDGIYGTPDDICSFGPVLRQQGE